jgi:multicomponent Na+:H+ antiporter subunit G
MWAGVAVCVLAAVGMLLVREPTDRLHLLSPMNTLGGVLVVVAVAVETGWGRAAVKDLLIGLLLAGGGAVASAATAQAVRSGAPSGDPYVDDTGEG